MTGSPPTPSDIAFSPAVKAVQTAKGSRRLYAEGRPWPDRVTPDLADFIARQTSFFLGTASAGGQPYIQHRGGPPGFLRVLSDRRLGLADFAGNRQYITLGNLSENPRAFIFLIDYVMQRRVKLWGTAQIVEGDEALLDVLRVPDTKGRAERALLFDIETWDVNCPQHIPQRFEAADVAAALAARDARIAELETQLADLRRAAGPAPG
ncbi:pyridoxamine 5'-phosphate oxidase family protein [Zavarzinia compransoris]|uniref:pyridoxamine 5'-phosphate oxidase family protein n=1 Tax=Zavarzinia marina TaxID=2911065 RepID=UPI001F38E743|nr:pyridoxamine 5'-phosphate oxidase family protein [Zavarzinia marina]MCF4164252.1 pyridoxamine 5'-phosphate oxidase family protein [Zavarzinia marina]